jgi:hypothetical protein
MKDGVLVVMGANNFLRVLGGFTFLSGSPISTDFSDSDSEFFSKLRFSQAVLSISGSKVVSSVFKDLRPRINKMPKNKN